MALVSQPTPDIKRKLQRVEWLGEKSLRDLVTVAEKVYNSRDSAEERQIKAEKWQNRDLAKILLVATTDPEDRRRCLRQMASGGEGKKEFQREGHPVPILQGRRPLGKVGVHPKEGPHQGTQPQR